VGNVSLIKCTITKAYILKEKEVSFEYEKKRKKEAN
jgi:hypothetical protein